MVAATWPSRDVRLVPQIPPFRVVDTTVPTCSAHVKKAWCTSSQKIWGIARSRSQLNLSEHTVKNYLFRVFDKLGVSNRVELVLYAVANPPQIPRSRRLLEQRMRMPVPSKTSSSARNISHFMSNLRGP